MQAANSTFLLFCLFWSFGIASCEKAVPVNKSPEKFSPNRSAGPRNTHSASTIDDLNKILQRAESATWGSGNFDQYVEIISRADPKVFDDIVKNIFTIKDNEVRNNLLALAIFKLKSNQDLSASVAFVNELVGPGSDRNQILEECLFFAKPSPTECIRFLRELEYQEEIDFIVSRLGAVFSQENTLELLAKSDLKLANQESDAVIRGITDAILPAFSDKGLEQELLSINDQLILINDAVKSGTLPESAEKKFLNLVLQKKPEVVQMLYNGESELEAFFEKKATNFTVSKISKSRPEMFFTSDGIKLLPDDKISPAWTGWMEKDSSAAQQWFNRIHSQLSPSQTDQISMGLVNYAIQYGEIESAAKWIGFISDPEIKKIT